MTAAGLLAAGPVSSQALQGRIQVQYDNAIRTVTSERLESWLTAGEANYTTQIRRTTEVFSQIRFSKLAYAGREERFQRPEGLLRLAHPIFGLTASYEPSRVTDALGVERSQQTSLFDAYVKPQKLPSVSAFWHRIHRDAAPEAPGSAAEQREVSTSYDRGILNLHGTVGDQISEDERLGTRTKIEDHVTAGTMLRMQRHRVDGSVYYDFTQLRNSPGTPTVQTSQVHMAGVNGGRRFSPKTAATLNYTYRRVSAAVPGADATNEHNGTLSVAHTVSSVLQVSGGAGVRNAIQNGRQETESYLVGTATARALVREGWKADAGWSHSWNWLPSDPARMVDAVSAGTAMRLTRGLDLNGALSVSVSELPAAARDSSGGSSFVSTQASAGIRAMPLPPLVVNASTRRYNSGTSLTPDSPASTAHQVNLTWNPSSVFQSQGAWGRTATADRGQTTWLANLQWTPDRALQLSGNYTRSSTPTSVGVGVHSSARETYGARAVVLFNQDLVGTVQYTEADPGLATHRRQVSVTVTQAFRR